MFKTLAFAVILKQNCMTCAQMANPEVPASARVLPALH